ncbi:MAG: hypothetical protein IIA11_07940 [Proteobacteria bacterium]|nr:hypothetical protein [Pseudomonadota bacterium]
MYAAWLYLQRYALTDAINRFTQALRRLTIQFGVPGKYHETVSWFFLILISERRALAATDSWSAFRRDNVDIFRRDDNILARYYSSERISSKHARQSFLLPDKLA